MHACYFVHNHASHLFAQDASGSLLDLPESGTALPVVDNTGPEPAPPTITSLDCLEFRYRHACMIFTCPCSANIYS